MAAVAYPTRPQIRRNSPISVLPRSNGFATNAPVLKRFDVSDSESDDEPPPAIKFSKVTQAILADVPLPSSPPRQEQVAHEGLPFSRSVSGSKMAWDTPSRPQGLKIVRKSPPATALVHERGHTPPRIVQVGNKSSSSGKRSISISGPYPQRFTVRQDPVPAPSSKPELVTPAPAPRALRITRSRAGSNASQDGHANPPSSLGKSFSRPASRNGSRSAVGSAEQRSYGTELSRSASLHHAPETTSKYNTVGRVRNPSAEGAPATASTRIKRAPIPTGSFLKSGPIRRGFRRRESEDNISPTEDAQSGSASQLASAQTPQEGNQAEGRRNVSGGVNVRATSIEPVSVHDFAPQPNMPQPVSGQALSRSQVSNDSAPSSRQGYREGEQPRSRQPSAEPQHRRPAPSLSRADTSARVMSVEPLQPRNSSFDQQRSSPAPQAKPPQRVPSLSRAQYRYVAPKIHTNASEDQENMPPPTFKRNKDQEFKSYLGKSAAITVLSDSEDAQKSNKPCVMALTNAETPVPVHQQLQERKILGAISGNTPHRPAPAPPPKMSVLDTATTTAGASVTKSKKKRSHIVINGKIFTQMGKIGKGGSSDVYCVMAENYKTFALKRVKLSDCDESAVRGYKGEIDLLRRLTEVERVVRLFDWEENVEKQELCVLMEKGDTDLNRLLTMRLNGENARWDAVFTRFYWREMLECVQAVHEHDIVHSDLKPANFLLVQGRLKLIDFGIANAIETDHTVNVHRDSHVGTPNYMSPESITDTNAPAPGEGGNREAYAPPLKKDMRIGKASDVWSLGCILYQMTYGRPPFAHIQSQISRIMAITNPKHAIEFPETGVGGAAIPPALRRTLRRCLDREVERRPLIDEMLREDDAFLHPDAAVTKPVAEGGGVVMTEELLGQILTRVVERCRDPKRGVPTPEEVRQYPGSFLKRVREMQEGL